MTKLWKLPFILMLTTLIAASALSLVNTSTKPLIEEHKRQATIEALGVVSPSGLDGVNLPVINQNEEIDYYKCYTSPDTSGLVGYIFNAYGVGYSSTIETMVGIDTTGIIQSIIVLSQVETPGLGTKIMEVKYGDPEPWFQVQFKKRTIAEMDVDKDGGPIESITGATISSRAITKSIREAFTELEKKIGGFQKDSKPVI